MMLSQLDSKNKVSSSLQFFLLVFIILIGYCGYQKKGKFKERRKYVHEKYYENFNEKFLGVVTQVYDYPLIQKNHQSTLLWVNISRSSVDFYDPRDSVNHFMCLIFKKKAQVIVTRKPVTEREIRWHVGDSILFDGSNDALYRGRNGNWFLEDLPKLGHPNAIKDKLWLHGSFEKP